MVYRQGCSPFTVEAKAPASFNAVALSLTESSRTIFLLGLAEIEYSW
jgi:hypothetical protein